MHNLVERLWENKRFRKAWSVFIGSAWPYANGSLHAGHVAGLLPADVLARAHRLFGDEVLWTSGSDCHGTPITEKARVEGVSSGEIAKRYHQEFLQTFTDLGFSYSLYWATMDPNHHARVQASFLELYDKGLIVEAKFERSLCSYCSKPRADREIKGKCPHCGDGRARGDQCDNCGTELTPDELVTPVCSDCGSPIKFETSTELAFDLPALAERLTEWVGKQEHWRDNAKQWTEGWLRGGLKLRPISRKMDWGIPIPVPGWEDHCIYVWFEAVHGYLTASMQHAEDSGDLDAWKPFWDGSNPLVKPYYVIGKDNIPFHTLMWPGILMGRENLALPWHIVSSEFLGLEGKPLSTRDNWAIWVPDFLSRYTADSLRYFLIKHGPETRDVDFVWKTFIEVFNGEVVNNYGNLVSRVLKFNANKLNGDVPHVVAEDLGADDLKMFDRAISIFSSVQRNIEATKFRAAIKDVWQLAQWTNQYWNDRQPWKELKIDPHQARVTVFVAIQVIGALSILTEPFMPHQAAELRKMLMTDHYEWSAPRLESGHKLGQPYSLFERIDIAAAEAEVERLRAQ